MDGELARVYASAKPDISKLPGGWEPGVKLIPHLDEVIQPLQMRNGSLLIRNALSNQDCESLISLMNSSPSVEEVSVQGRKDVPDYRVGSTRTTLWSPHLATQLWKKLSTDVGEHTAIKLHSLSATDWWQGDKERVWWWPVGLSPMFRFMRYEEGGQHYAHYDAGFIYPNDNYRTLKSVVIYLTTNREGGATRFIKDGQSDIPIWDRKHEDWLREVKPEEVTEKVQPIRGSILVFDHRLCHDVELYTGKAPRIIIRADILYRSVNGQSLEDH